MKHDILGEIEQTGGDPFEATATILHESRNIQVGMLPDDQPLEVTLSLAAQVVSGLAELDKVAKKVASRDLLALYNEEWNSDDEDEDEDGGSIEPGSNPPLSETEFESKLTLRAINVSGSKMVDLYYDDQGMFLGHSVLVSSFDGADFGKAVAELFG